MTILHSSDVSSKFLNIAIFLYEPLKGKMMYIFQETLYKGLYSIITPRSMNRQNGDSQSYQY